MANAPEAKAAVKRAVIIGEYTKLVRDLINTPPSHLTPDSFSKRFAAAVKICRRFGCPLKSFNFK
jgi:leucyl aminopeptidase